MAAGDIETFHRNGIWFNRIEGESQTLGSSFLSEAEAVKRGMEEQAEKFRQEGSKLYQEV